MDEDDYTIETLPACPMQVIDGVILVLDFTTNMVRAGLGFWSGLTELVMGHANYQVAQREFARTVGEEIERLVTGNE